MNIDQVLMRNYLPYAKGTIIARALSAIDGFKPSQRRVLYSMYKMGLLKKDCERAKSVKIAGQTVAIHPHGDDAIYETMVRMTQGNESLNVPYVDGKGNFGKVYSDDIECAAKRYTSARLAPIAAEIFSGINEDAVDFIPNFDNTTTEPVILPVKFPNILVNPSNGIAVGMSSNIPPFALASVCEATEKILKNEVTDCEQLADILGVPEYSTGGVIFTDKKSLVNLMKTGRGSVSCCGRVTTYSSHIDIMEIPYNTTCEKIKSEIINHIKTGELKEVTHVINSIDIKGFKMTVRLKRGADAELVLKKIYRYTSLHSHISYNTRVIIGNRAVSLGIMDLLKEWIKFRQDTLRRIYNHRLVEAEKSEHKLACWEKIQNNIKDVGLVLTNNTYDNACIILKNRYGLDDIQLDYLMSMRVNSLTTDRAKKSLAELQEVRNNISEYKSVIGSDAKVNSIIIRELAEIREKYGEDKKTAARLDGDISFDEVDNIKEEVSDRMVSVVITKKFFIKRLVTMNDFTKFRVPEDDEELMRLPVKNNDTLLVFTSDGTVHKLFVNDIDASGQQLQEKITVKLGLQNERIIWIDNAGDYSGYFNLVYANGRGYRVYYSKVMGKRKKYVGLFQPLEEGEGWITQSDQFFTITRKRKAAYIDLKWLSLLTKRSAFKVARISTGDAIVGLLPVSYVPNISMIDLERYQKGYTVCIGDDPLFPVDKVKKESEQQTSEQASGQASEQESSKDSEN